MVVAAVREDEALGDVVRFEIPLLADKGLLFSSSLCVSLFPAIPF